MCASLLLALTAVLVMVDLASSGGLLLLCLAVLFFPFLAVATSRFAKRSDRTLVRSSGRLLLNGEPLEMTRVELRVLKMPLTRVPTGYVLSLWVMTASGPEDVPIGRFATLLHASALSGQLEDFVQRGNLKAHRHA